MTQCINVPYLSSPQDVASLARVRLGAEHVVAISGGSDAMPSDSLLRIVDGALEEFTLHEGVVILTGGTKDGLPQIATERAKALGLRTVGVTPAGRIERRGLPDGTLDLVIAVGDDSSRFTDETPYFTILGDACMVIGGGAGTMAEVGGFLKKDKPVVAIRGAGGLSEVLANGRISGLKTVPAYTLPRAAAAYLMQTLGAQRRADL